ncbi:hypothetical protein M8C21_003921 [Ambrosia artemisiifolia]|uniref:Peptidase C14 caspase domain-containing protein n=1 Tax=Ambrosia artemisiifolia TaxID=4212 RepID=A0AAD5G600_AMBAR|nr:hypothetical protein M8C21_003921 [Ambrosia artemisiifolia]
MSSSYRTVPMSSSYRRGMLSMNERGEFVSDDGDEDGETCLQPNKGGVKFFSDTEGLFQKMFYRRDVSDFKLLDSYKKSTLESIRNWETTKGKRALLCGVTYNKQKYKLKGANFDVINMRQLLISRFQFPSSSIHILAEIDTCPPPTKRNIQEALRWLVKDNQPGDSLVFYFSGHGSQILDFFDDELDGYDETICPVDFKTEGMITDNEINDTIVRPLKRGVKLHAIIDASHSGTILDLPHVYSTKMLSQSQESKCKVQ